MKFSLAQAWSGKAALSRAAQTRGRGIRIQKFRHLSFGGSHSGFRLPPAVLESRILSELNFLISDLCSSVKKALVYGVNIIKIPAIFRNKNFELACVDRNEYAITTIKVSGWSHTTILSKEVFLGNFLLTGCCFLCLKS